MLSQNKLAPKRCCQKFSKLNFEKIARRHLLKSKKYWNYIALLDIMIATTIIQLSSFFVLYILLIHLVSTFDEVSNEMHPTKSLHTLGGPMMKQFVLQSSFLCITEAY